MQERTFKCANCKKQLELFQIHYLPGQNIYDPISGMRYDTGQNYCGKCYKEHTGQNILEEKQKLKNITLIRDAIVDSNINLLAKVEEKISDTTNEKGLRIGTFKIKDSSAEIILVVWNNIIDRLKAGDEIYLENGYVRDWKGEKRITPGRNGVIKRM